MEKIKEEVRALRLILLNPNLFTLAKYRRALARFREIQRELKK